MQHWDDNGTNLASIASPGGYPQADGDLLVLAVGQQHSGTSTVTGVSGSVVTTWTEATSHPAGADGGPPVSLWYGVVTSTGSSTISVSWSSTPGGWVDLSADEYATSSGSWTLSNTDSTQTDSSASVAFPALESPPTGSSLYTGYGYVCQTGTGGSSSGFTFDVTAFSDIAAYDTTLADSTVYTPVGSESPAGCSVTVGAIFTAGEASPHSPMHVQHWDDNGTNLASISSPSGYPKTDGDLLVLGVGQQHSGTATVTGVSGGGVTTWTEATSHPAGADGPPVSLWYGVVTSTGSSTISVSWSSTPGGWVDLSVDEYAASSGSWSLGNGDSTQTDSSASVAFPALETPASGSSLYAGYGYVCQTGTGGSSSGFSFDVTAFSDIAAYDTSLANSTVYAPVGSESPAGCSITVGAIFTAGEASPPSSTHVQHWDDNGTNLASISSPSSYPQTDGDLLVLGVGQVHAGTATVTAVSGGGVTTWTEATSHPAGADGPPVSLWYGVVTSTGSSTISVSWSSTPGGGVDLSVDEYAASGGSWTLGNTDSTQTSSSASVAFPALETPASGSSLYTGYGYICQTGTGGSTSGYTFTVTAASNLAAYNTSLAQSTVYTPAGSESPAGCSVTVGAIFTAGETGNATTVYVYNANDELTLVTDPDGQQTLSCYDGDGNLTETVPPVGVAADSLTPADCPVASGGSYDYGDRLASDATTYAYDALGDQTEITSPAPAGLSGSETTINVYDPAGQLLSTVSPAASNAGGATTQVTGYSYDNAGQLLTLTRQGYDGSATSITSYCYDPDGNRTATVPPDANTSSVAACSGTSPYQTSSTYQTGYSYDSLGELVSKTTPTTSFVTSPTSTYSYDPAGNLLSSEDPNGVTTTNTYTPLDQLATVDYSDSTPDASYQYDANGNRVSMSDDTGTSSYDYDPFNELTSYQNGAGKTVSYSYDGDGNTTAITYPLGGGASWASSDTVGYSYDNADELSAVTDFNGNTVTVANNADGLPNSENLGPTGDTITTSYDPTDTPSDITLANGTPTTLQEFAYSDDPSGAIDVETDTPSSALEPVAYYYDAQNRITTTWPGTGSPLNTFFDASGNLTTLPTQTSATSYDHASELTSSTLSGTTTNYTYDADGERTQEAHGMITTMSASYNGAQEVTAYSNASADMKVACYDGDGLRQTFSTSSTSCASPTETFTWDPTGSLPHLLMDSENAYIYGPDNAPIEQISLSSGDTSYLISDLLGSVRGIVDGSDGSLTDSTSYDAWGNPLTGSGLTADTPFGYAGSYTDPTGLTYNIGRYYDPQTGQFLSMDPLVARSGQAYAYADGDPVENIDPTGQLFGISCGACHTIVHDAVGGLEDVGQGLGDAGVAIYNGGSDVVTYIAGHPVILNTVALIGATVATVATDGATSELLYAELEVTFTEDGVVESTTITTVTAYAPSETSALGDIAGSVGLRASFVQGVANCLHKQNAVCALDVATSVIGIGAAGSDWEDMSKVLIGQASTDVDVGGGLLFNAAGADKKTLRNGGHTSAVCAG